MNSTTLTDGTLSIDECWELLAADTLRRLAVVVDGHPDIFPLNYGLDCRSIVFRTAGGTKLWNAKTARPALAIDGYDTRTEVAWSVVVRGVTEVILNDAEKAIVDTLHLEPWQPGAKDHYVRLTGRALTGRRFKVSKPELWTTRLSDPRRASFD